MRKAGWVIDRNKWPKCKACRDKDRLKYVETHPEGPALGALSIKKNTSQPILLDARNLTLDDVFKKPKLAPELDAKQRRGIYARLEAHFDDDKSEYKEGWSDARVAEEIGAEVESVALIRAESYGTIKRNVDLVQVIDDIEFVRLYADDQLKALRDEVERRVAAIEKRVFG